jgi:hypothetical protein
LQKKPVNKPVRPVGNGPMAAMAVAGAVMILILAYVLQYSWGMGDVQKEEPAVASIAPVGAVRVTEVMSSNKSAWADEKGKFPDWVELQNTSDAPIDLMGWSLVDDMDKLIRFTFPQMTLAPGECVLVYCDDDLKNTAGYPFHAPFKLSAQGDQVLVFDAAGNVMESLVVPALPANQAYRLTEQGQWEISAQYTPGRPNSEQPVVSAAVANSPVRINELMADNATYAGRDGVYDDWIELYNSGSADTDLSGYYLSDDSAKPLKWRIPSAVIPAGGYLVVYASGRDDTDLDANFKLNPEGESLLLSDAEGRLIDRVDFGLIKTDQSYSREADSWTDQLAPTPGLPNTRQSAALLDGQMASANTVRLFINEAMASARQENSAKAASDWAEIYNQGTATIDLSGYGLSDDPSRPRKWQFPAGSKLAGGEYLRVLLNGLDRHDLSKNAFATSFKLSLNGAETLVLAAPDGTILDRMPMMRQLAGISYGRISGRDGFFYLDSATPGALNSQTPFDGRSESVQFSQPGGWFSGGDVVVSLSAPAGATIRYTTDCSEPGESSPEYDGPLTFNQTTILRARAFEPGLLPSPIETQSYLFGPGHTLDVVSLVADPAALFDEEKGMLVMGPKKLKYPYKEANFWQAWERTAHVEYFTTGGETLLSQGAGLALQGQYSRMQDQKAFKITARNVYGGNRFSAKLFPNRDYTQYKSFILRSSGQDTNKTRYRDALLTSLAAPTSVMYQDSVPVVVYLNGQFWGHYNMRERVHKYAIAQWEGWENPDAIDIVKANSSTMQGSNKSFESLLSWIKQNGIQTDENLAYVEARIDLDNYLEYIALQTFIGNTDLLNVKRYRSDEGDGRWRWIIFDTDWAFYTDTDSFGRWLKPGGMGSGNKTDNSLFIALMKNASVRDRYLTLLGNLMADEWTSEKILAKSQWWQDALAPEMPAQAEKWGGNQKGWLNEIKRFNAYASERPKKLLNYIRKSTGYDAQQMRAYFGRAMDQISD